MTGQNSTLEANKMSHVGRVKNEATSLTVVSRGELLGTIGVAAVVAALAIWLDGAYIFAFGLVPAIIIRMLLDQYGATKAATPLIWRWGNFASAMVYMVAVAGFMAYQALKS